MMYHITLVTHRNEGMKKMYWETSGVDVRVFTQRKLDKGGKEKNVERNKWWSETGILRQFVSEQSSLVVKIVDEMIKGS